MPKAMDVDAISIFEVLTGHLFIPRYQRQYSWTEDEHEQFWEDLRGSRRRKGIDNFLGEIVLKRRGPEKKDGLEVVDGQQRLTTVTILLAVIRDSFEDLADEHFEARNMAEDVQKLIAERDLRYGQRNVIEAPNNGPNNGEFFREFIQCRGGGVNQRLEEINSNRWGAPKSNLLLAGYLHFVDSINGEIGLSSTIERKYEILNEVLRQLVDSMVIQVVLAEDQDAYTIFETLNDRGVPLASSDLIKNTVLSRLQGNDRSDRLVQDHALGAWMGIVENISGISEKRFSDINAYLYYQWISRSYASGSVPQKELRKSVEGYLQRGKSVDPKRMSERTRAEGYLRDLTDDLALWGLLADTSASAWKNALENTSLGYSDQTVGQVRLYVDGILTCAGMQPTAAVLTTLRLYLNSQLSFVDCRRALRAIETFHFRQKGSSQSSQGLRDAYRKYCAALNSPDGSAEFSRGIDSLIWYLSKNTVLEDVTLENIKSLKYARSGAPRKFLLYFLGRYADAMKLSEFQEYVNSPGFVVKDRSFGLILSDPEGGLTLEHLVPQKPLKGAVRLSDEVVQSIGNLALISNPENVRLSNKGFAAKRSILKNRRGQMDPILGRCLDDLTSDWGEDEVRARAHHLAEVAVRNLWTFDLPDSAAGRLG